jgi:hypothetical protein
LTNGDLATHADAIVIGRCTAVDSRWEDRNLFTFFVVTRDLTGVYFARGQAAPAVSVPLPAFKAEVQGLLKARSRPGAAARKSP